jgi:hypothetical protein
MSSATFSKTGIFLLLIMISTCVFAQTNADKIKGTWVVEKMEPVKQTAQSRKAQQELQGMYLTFGTEEVTISKKTADSVLKKGAYSILGSTLTFGKDEATIVLLDDKNLNINIPSQGILYLLRL